MIHGRANHIDGGGRPCSGSLCGAAGTANRSPDWWLCRRSSASTSTFARWPTSYANDGFLAVAPALFDRIERDVELGYEGADVQKAMSFIPKLDIDKAVARCRRRTRFRNQDHRQKSRRDWILSRAEPSHGSPPTRLHPDAAVGYYGGRIGNYAHENPSCPVMLHFGRKDTHIPAEEVEKVHAAHPEVEIYWYDAGHAFNATPRTSYNAEAARLARERSLAFLKKILVSS